MKKNEPLPVFGIGPVYVVSILFLTIVAVILRNSHVFSSGTLVMMRMPLVIVGAVFIILAVFIWIQAVIVSKLDENIKNNNLISPFLNIIHNIVFKIEIKIITT